MTQHPNIVKPSISKQTEQRDATHHNTTYRIVLICAPGCTELIGRRLLKDHKTHTRFHQLPNGATQRLKQHNQAYH